MPKDKPKINIARNEITHIVKKHKPKHIIQALYLSGCYTVSQIAEITGASLNVVRFHCYHEKAKCDINGKDLQVIRQDIAKIEEYLALQIGFDTRLSIRSSISKLIDDCLNDAKNLEFKSKGEAIACAIKLQELFNLQSGKPTQFIKQDTTVSFDIQTMKDRAKEILKEENLNNEINNVIEAEYDIQPTKELEPHTIEVDIPDTTIYPDVPWEIEEQKEEDDINKLIEESYGTK